MAAVGAVAVLLVLVLAPMLAQALMSVPMPVPVLKLMWEHWQHGRW